MDATNPHRFARYRHMVRRRGCRSCSLPLHKYIVGTSNLFIAPAPIERLSGGVAGPPKRVPVHIVVTRDEEDLVRSTPSQLSHFEHDGGCVNEFAVLGLCVMSPATISRSALSSSLRTNASNRLRNRASLRSSVTRGRRKILCARGRADVNVANDRDPFANFNH